MDPLIKCSVCLKNNPILVNIWETDENNVKWSYKLSSCVPELEWSEEYLICSKCIQQLEAACAFRNLCLQSLVQKRQLNDIIIKKDVTAALPDHQFEDNIEITCDTGGTDDIYEAEVLRYQCKYCREAFADDSVLVEHNKNEHGFEEPYDCLFCNHSFKMNEDLQTHEETHFDENDNKCHLCNIKFNTTTALRKHRTVKHTTQEKEKFTCSHCDRKFLSKFDCNSHIAQEHCNKNDVCICYHCNSVYKNKVLLTKHIESKHAVGKYKECEVSLLKNHKSRKYLCDKCSGTFVTNKELKNHADSCAGIKTENTGQCKVEEEFEIEIKTDEIGEPELAEQTKNARKRVEQISNVCQICGMVFNTRYLAKRHLRNVHATEKNYQCNLCEERFVSPVYLNAHKRYHSRERTHICSFCGKGFITGSDLYHHEKIHANKRAYKCEKCPKAFNTSSDLHKHKLCVHQDRNKWKYACSYCDRRFPLKTNLNAHTKTHTGERNFQCHLCERRCVNRSVLLRHIKSHSNVRMYGCTVCNMEYKYQKSLDIHMAKVHGIGDAKIPERIKKYFCHICPKSYFANNKLQKHIRTHTGERPFSCAVCEKKFIDKSYVKQHLKSAHNIPFEEFE